MHCLNMNLQPSLTISYPITAVHKLRRLKICDFLMLHEGNYLDPTLTIANSAWKDISAAIYSSKGQLQCRSYARAATQEDLC